MLHRVLSLKNKAEDIPALESPSILNENGSLYSFLKRKEILVAVSLHREDILYVGKIKDVGPKSFILDSYGTELEKSGLMNIDFTKVRYIQIHSDYLDSLGLLLDYVE